MPVIEKEDVQQWLEQTKLRLESLDKSLEATARAVAYSVIGATYDTSTWNTVADTPTAVKAAISMLVAAWHYQRAYSENDGASEYGLHLEQKAMAFLDGIASGENDLVEVPGTLSDNVVAFWPNDSTGTAEVYNANGHLVGASGSEDVMFWMGQRF